MKKSGYNETLQFKPNEQRTPRQRKRTRNVTWYNPPFDLRVKTNVGGQFLKIVRESFPKGHVLHSVFNRNTLKLSYSCMPSMKAVVDTHNARVTKAQTTEVQPTTKPCNCRDKNNCPLDRKCRTKNIVYQATVASMKGEETYVGLTSTEFKQRHGNHNLSFRYDKYRYQTELSKHIWSLKDQNVEYNIRWQILKHAKPYSTTTKRCNLCIMEKYFIICHPTKSTLNKRSELAGACRHAAKFKLTRHVASP